MTLSEVKLIIRQPSIDDRNPARGTDGRTDLQEGVWVADVEDTDNGGQRLHVPLLLVKGQQPLHQPLL